MKTAFFVSPHLDDVVFSCGGTLAKFADDGWQTILCTIFTKSVANPQGFALRCQLDKNLAADVDYMKLRRAEDFRAAKILKASEVLHLNFPEAPHRGYESATELFAGEKRGDDVREKIAEHLETLAEIHQPEIIFAPQGLGNHVDHLQTIRAVLDSFKTDKIHWYYDTPYVVRQPEAQRYQQLPPLLEKKEQDISAYLEAKIEACAAYASQINFQFGSRRDLEELLTDFHFRSNGEFVENFLAAVTDG